MQAFLVLLAICLPLIGDVFVDQDTALMWQDVAENREVALTWPEAKANCEDLELAGYDDWWLPSENEMSTLIDTNRPQGRKIKKGIIYYKNSGAYWTSSTYAWNAPYAWVVDFGTGATYTLEKEERRFVRCVRCSDFKRCIELFYTQ